MTTESLTAPAVDASAATDAPEAPAAGNTYSVLGLVLSILSIPTGMGPLAIAGIVLGFLGRSKEPAARTAADWAIIVGFIALFWWVGFALLAAAFLLPVIFTGAWLGAF